MSKPESYPFLRIARQFQADYARVLRLADVAKFHGPIATTTPGDVALFDEINKATLIQMRIREGVIDWLTGEELCVDEGCPHHGTLHVCITKS